jgi:methylmalonyl-CoA/ethylmalonyl-CoA epimerase
VGIVVHKIENYANTIQTLLTPQETTIPFHNKIQHVKVCFFNLGGFYIELIEPAELQTPVTSFLENKGEGIHHLAFEVPDVELATLELEKAGGKVISLPSIGFEDRIISFVYVNSLPCKIIEFVSEKKSS